MRTTLTLDDDLANDLREAARRSGRSFRDVVNTVLRKGLSQLVDETAIEDFERTSRGDGRDTAGQRES